MTLALVCQWVTPEAFGQWTGSTIQTTTTQSSVGIGTNSPSQALQVVNGNILLDQTDVAANRGNIFLGGITFPALNPGMRLSHSVNSNNGYIDVRNTTSATPNTDGLIFRIDNNLNNAGTERMRICNNGNVGIGIAAPAQRFHLHNGVAMLSGANGFGGPMLVFSSNLGTHPNGQWGIEYEPNERGLNFWKPFGNTGPGAQGNYFLFLSDDDGAVSIGTKNSPAAVGTNNTSAYRLFVKGGILTDELLVQTGWADYVFAQNYPLPSLADVENHIAEKGCLPNVPSEKEIVENGLNVGKMAVTQQEKIEELFLYVIQLNKDIQTLRAENASLRQLLNAQKRFSDEK